jgi:hypothetical protein
MAEVKLSTRRPLVLGNTARNLDPPRSGTGDM